MPPLRFLVAESELASERKERRDSVGQSSGETYEAFLGKLLPSASIDLFRPIEHASRAPDLAGYDAVFLTGSPMHVQDETPDTRRVVEFMRAVFRSGTPSFGSCAGLQVATVAAGGKVRSLPMRVEAGFARRITPTEAGQHHPLLAGRPASYDALTIHSDEVEELPDGATRLAGNAITSVQAAEIRWEGGVFWGVQYHPELTLGEVAAALRRQGDELIAAHLVRDAGEVEIYAGSIDALDRAPDDPGLAWRLGLDREVTDPERRSREVRNFVESLVLKIADRRGRSPGRRSAATGTRTLLQA